ncbi:MAG TPA: hypothetical protein VFP36_03540 [Usitatibacter sp.]|nr:hypothetical protein [Usitatibacter sp.]
MAVAAFTAACASDPPAAIREGSEELSVTAVTWIGKPDLFAPPGPLRWPDALQGARCTLANDKGTWVAMTPAQVRIERSSSPLIVDCVLEGYKPVHEERSCLSEREREHERNKVEGPLAVAMIPLAVAAAPVAPQLAADAAVRAGMYGASVAASAMRGAGKPDYCTYGRVSPNMWPQ